MKLDPIQRFVVNNYEDGEFSYIESLKEARDCGDSLLLFLLRELSVAQDCCDLDTATTRLDMAIAQLSELRNKFMSDYEDEDEDIDEDDPLDTALADL
jgi:hypothetical protein